MKRAALYGLAAVSACLLLAGAGRRGSRGGGASPGGRSAAPRRAGAAGPRVLIRMRRFSVPRPAPIRSPAHVVRDRRRITWPRFDGSGAAISKQAAKAPPQSHASIARNGSLVRNILARQRAETVPGRYYWHADNKVKYAHYYDRQGIQWYGFYHGPAFYWTRHYEGRWWWYDQRAQRWVYWADGFWWWQAPSGTPFVYVENNYYPYEQPGVVTVNEPEPLPPPTSTPSSSSEGRSTTSPDGARMVQVFGPKSEAFLYNTSAAEPAFLKYLGQDVDKVAFSSRTAASPQVLLNFKDGSFAIYDQDGNPQNAPTAPAEEPPGPPPEALPPPPDIPSGQ